ncbi:ABC transporter ATP-binding protein [Mycobacterium spongiae]|uniref:ATP-binding cassette domain-containing protein n=1 Tax=Mycobacterium spongiae TaxID=886343 RepID=A0A975JYH1_9MYCO|nr:ABC transporter ATP-binding protein [Mycobacterium spongiae]QUR68040.1 ATP-binding cassette domain-containing protein [Mycobacterium spongiae]
MTELVIRTDGLVKNYGDVRALDGLDLAVEQGEIFGFLGPNGAGKSTTIRILLDLLRPTTGRVEVLGIAPVDGGAALRGRIGYLPGELALQGRRTAGELLHHLAALRGGAGAERIAPLAERFALALDRPVRALSKGNKQKVGVVQAFMHEPELLVLDEPTSGLDPLLQREFLDLVLEAREGGASVLMSSHILSEVEDIADRVGIISAGRMVDVDNVDTLRHHAGQTVELRFADRIDVADFGDLPGVQDAVVNGTTLTCVLHGEPDSLLKRAAAHHVVGWSAQFRELDELFLYFYQLPTTTATNEEVPAHGH